MRACGECTVCCTDTRVPELNKPERVRCQHCAIGKGCRIYASRPASCFAFQCAWSQGKLPEAMRPDKCGVMVEDYGAFVFAMSDHGEWMQAAAALNEFVDRGVPVVIGMRGGSHMLLPSGTTPEQVMASVRKALNGRA